MQKINTLPDRWSENCTDPDMKHLLHGLLYMTLSIALPARAQSPIGPIQGWKMKTDGGHYSYTPTALIGSIPINYDIYPPVAAGNGDLADWLPNIVQKDLADLHYTPLPGKPGEQDIKTIKFYSVGVKDAAGKQWLVSYMVFTRADGLVRYGRIIESPVSSIKPYMTTAVQHFITICKKEGGLPENSTASNDKPAATQKTPPQKKGTPTTAPGQGLQPSQIRGIAMHLEYSTGVGGMTIIVYNSYLLLQDGTCYKHCEVSPYDLDVPGSRVSEPNQWGTWKLEDKTLSVTMNNDHKTDKWDKNWFWGRPAVKNEKITGSYHTISGGGNTALGGGAMVYASGNITFSDQGQFTRVSSGGGSNSGPTGSVTAYSNKDAAGVYIFDGYSLELHYNNGTVVRRCFYFYPKTKDTFSIGDNDYVPVK